MQTDSNGHSSPDRHSTNKVGVAVIGLGGAVATTAVAGIALLRTGRAGEEGLPLADLPPALTEDLIPYSDLIFSGWDLNGDDLAQAARAHNVLPPAQLAEVAPELSGITPWKAVANSEFCRNIQGKHVAPANTHRQAISLIRANLRTFREEQRLRRLVVLNLASTEACVDRLLPQFEKLSQFESALDSNTPEIGPAMLYAYAAIRERAPFINFTPSVAADVPALVELAEREKVPLCGKDGKTGQTMIKTVLAPALRARALRVDGWYSTNILGNRDGLALDDKNSLASKLATKGSVLDQILGYKVDDHLVDIRYYRPRGDNKESWDNIDITGFLGQPMQIKVNFLCRDSILAAPLAIELARLMDLAQRRGCTGVQSQFGAFFKQPMTGVGQPIAENAFHVQQEILLSWLEEAHARNDVRAALPMLESVAGD